MLFPSLKPVGADYGVNSSKWFGRLKKRLGFGEEHVFHCFRHTIANELKNLRVDREIRQGILGHSQGKSTDVYTQAFDPDVLQPAIEMISIKGLENVKPFYDAS